MRNAGLQRFEPVAGRGPTHVDSHQVVVGPGERPGPDRQLYEVLRS